MARSNLAAVATDETGEAPARKRRGGRRGPMQFFVEYEVVDQSGQKIEGAKAKFVRVEKDKAAVTKRVLEGEKIDNLMIVTVPLNVQQAAEEQAEAA
jgi:hypothetical protein